MWVTFGWKVTLLYEIIAAGVSVLASIILDSLGFERLIIAINAPRPIPFVIKTDARGITASARIYSGIPTTALNGMAKGLSAPA